MRTYKLSVFCLMPGLVAACCLFLAAGNLWAHGGGGDIALFTTEGQADVGFAVLDDDDITQISFDPDESLFQSILLPDPGLPFVPWEFASSEPGYDANEGALPGSALITMNTLEISYWDGTGAVDFGPVAGLNAGYAPQPLQAFPDGGFHSHPFFGLEDPIGTVSDGVFLTKMTVSIDGLADSDPYFMVSLIAESINGIADEEERIATAEAVGQLVRDYLADPIGNPAPIYNSVDYTYYADGIMHVRALIPEPGSALLATMGLVSLLAGRRRKPAA